MYLHKRKTERDLTQQLTMALDEELQITKTGEEIFTDWNEPEKPVKKCAVCVRKIW